MSGSASKGLAIVFASAAAACSPSAVTKCEEAALAHYCTAVTQILGNAVSGVLGAVFVAKSRAYERLGDRLGYHHLKKRYFEAAFEELTPAHAPPSSTTARLVDICFSHKPAAIREFVKATKQTCGTEK
jgi:hypothetical protein